MHQNTRRWAPQPEQKMNVRLFAEMLRESSNKKDDRG